MKTITLTVDFVVNVSDDDFYPDSLALQIPIPIENCKVIDVGNKCKVVGEAISYETTGFIEEENVGLGEFEEK